MAILNIIKDGNPILRKKSKTVYGINSEIKKLINDMIETMYSANGIGLAANQVGVLLRIIVIDITPEKTAPIVLINPEIIEKEGKLCEYEGCLSFPGLNLMIKRARFVKVKGLNDNCKPVEIEAEGLLSRVLQHEIDHLSGIVFIDRIPKKEKIKLKISGLLNSNKIR